MKTVFGKKKSRVNKQTLGCVSPSHISILANVPYWVESRRRDYRYIHVSFVLICSMDKFIESFIFHIKQRMRSTVVRS